MSKCFDCGDHFMLHAESGGRCLAGLCQCPKFNEFPTHSWKLKAELTATKSALRVAVEGLEEFERQFGSNYATETLAKVKEIVGGEDVE